LEERLSKPGSLEQLNRISQLLGEIRRLPDRETQLLWKDEQRPVDKLLFDQDKDRVYAFTKPDKEKRVDFFEIAGKPEPQLFTGKANPDTFAGVPQSVRLFLEYARFKGRKRGRSSN